MMKFNLLKKNKACPQCLKHSFCRRGFTLVETLVAISIFTVSLLGLMSILASSISDTNYVKQKLIASYLAQEGIEYVRNMRDTNVISAANGQTGWNNFKTKLNPCNLGNECGFDKSVIPFDVKKCNQLSDCKLFINNGDYNTNTGSDSGFVRKIWMTTSGGNSDEVKISSIVSWTHGSGNYNITFSENLFNWVE